jgi:large subunit ribosomal protein L25
VVEWDAPVEKLWLWNVQVVKDSIEIEALPKDLPHNIVVDISKLETTNDVIFVKDLDLWTWVELIDDPEQAVVIVSAIAEEEEEVVEESSEVAGEEKTWEEKTEWWEAEKTE